MTRQVGQQAFERDTSGRGPGVCRAVMPLAPHTLHPEPLGFVIRVAHRDCALAAGDSAA
jgi:hypothetical protein